MKLLKCFYLFLVLVVGCQVKKNDRGGGMPVYDLKKLTKTTQVSLSELGFIDVLYVPLETVNEGIINKINEIKCDNASFILHYYNDILKFDANGLLKCRIGTEGRGPGEFITAHEIDFDEITHKIYLVDGWIKRFFVYSGDGKLLRTFNSPFNTTKFILTGDSILCFSTNYIGNVDTSFVLIDTVGNILMSFPNRYPWHYKVQQGTAGFEENLFYKFNNRIFKKEIYSDTVFKFQNGSFLPHIVIRHRDKLLNTKSRSEFSPEFLLENYISQKRIFEFGDYLYYEFAIGLIHNKRYCLIGSKKTGSQYLMSFDQGLINDLDGGPNILPKTVKDENTIVGWVDAIKLKNHVASKTFKNSNPKYPEKKKELEKLANSLKETDNPVLVLVRLKQ